MYRSLCRLKDSISLGFLYPLWAVWLRWKFSGTTLTKEMASYHVWARQSFKRGIIFRNTFLPLMRNPRRPMATRICSYWDKEDKVWYLQQACLSYFHKLVLQQRTRLAHSRQPFGYSGYKLRRFREDHPSDCPGKQEKVTAFWRSDWKEDTFARKCFYLPISVCLSIRTITSGSKSMNVYQHHLCNIVLPSCIG